MTSASRPLVLPDYKCELLSKSQLELVVAQITFPPLPKFNVGPEVEREYTLAFAERVRRRYPRMQQEPQLKIFVTDQGVQPVPGEPLLRFTDLDQRWSVVIGKEHLSLEAFQYTGYQEFSERLREIASIAKEAFSIDYQLRCGLRFVNELRFVDCQKYSDFWSLLNHDIVGYNPEDLFDAEAVGLINEATVRRDDGVLRLRRGFLQGTTIRKADNPPKQGPFYLIDLDYFDEKPQEFQIDVTERFAAYNHYMFRVFRFILEEKLYKRLK